MKETHVFLAPDYYPQFRCKMGECRHSCCEGWSVTVSLEDYYRLLNAECGDALRARIIASLRMTARPTPDEYAEIAHDYTGQCRLRMSDGRCMLHAEAGEDALAPLCRLYPRGVRSKGGYECSCACSCERTLELLFRTEPIRFIEWNMTLDMPKGAAHAVYFEMAGREQEIRLHFISIVQNRRMPLYMRLLCLSEAIERMDAALERRDEAAVNTLLQSEPSISKSSEEPTREALSFGLNVAERLISIMDERSDALRAYGQAALERFADGDVLEVYRATRSSFEKAFPEWETFFENMLVNHMFFARFPSQDRPDSLRTEKSSLDAVYALLRFVGIGSGTVERAELIDVFHAVFRLIDHTDFDRYAGRILETKLRFRLKKCQTNAVAKERGQRANKSGERMILSGAIRTCPSKRSSFSARLSP